MAFYTVLPLSFDTSEEKSNHAWSSRFVGSMAAARTTRKLAEDAVWAKSAGYDLSDLDVSKRLGMLAHYLADKLFESSADIALTSDRAKLKHLEI